MNKTDELESILLCYEPDVVVLTETWLRNDVLDSELVPDGYVIMRRDRGSRGGGVALIISKDIECTPMVPLDIESIFAKSP